MERKVERNLQELGVRRWRELVTGQNGRTLCDRPKPTTGCSVIGRRRRSRKRSSGIGSEKMGRAGDRTKRRNIVRQAKANNGL